MTDDEHLDRATEFLAEPEAAAAEDAAVAELGERVIEALRSIYDPEIPVNIFELGLIYKVDIEDDSEVKIAMTLTSPACPVAESLPDEVKTKVEMVEGVGAVDVQIVWDPPWHPGMMTEEAQLELGMM